MLRGSGRKMVSTGYYCYGCGWTQCRCNSQYPVTVVSTNRPYVEAEDYYKPFRKAARGDRRSRCDSDGFPLTSLPLRWLIADLPANDPPVAVLPRRTPRARIAARRRRPLRSRPGAKRAA
jgi:hypothetical protein